MIMKTERECISTYEFKRYFNKYYYDQLRQQLLADREDLYHSNTTATTYNDEMTFVSCRKTEDIVTDLFAIDTRLQRLDMRYKKYEKIFQLFTNTLDMKTLQQIDTYLTHCDETIQEPKAVTDLRYLLYPIVCADELNIRARTII